MTPPSVNVRGSEWQPMGIADELSTNRPPRLARLKLRLQILARRVAQAPTHILAICSAVFFGLCLWIFLPPRILPGFYRGHRGGYPYPDPSHSWRWPPLRDDTFGHSKPSGTNWDERAKQVKEAFQHAYHGYELYAMPADELLPVTNKAVNK